MASVQENALSAAGLHPGPRWEKATALPKLPSWRKEGGCSIDKYLTPSLCLAGLATDPNSFFVNSNNLLSGGTVVDDPVETSQ